MVTPPSIFYIVSTVLFHKYGGVNSAVTNFMSHFSMFVSTKATVKLSNGNTGNAQGIEIILCIFTNCSIIHPVGPVYYCLGHPSNTISSDSLKFYVGFQNFTSEPLGHCDFVDPQGSSWRPPYQTQNYLDYLQILNLSMPTLEDTRILLYQMCVLYQNKISLNLLISGLIMSLLTD